MVKKHSKVNQKVLRIATIQSAVAIQLHTSEIAPTAKQCFKKLTEEIKKWLSDPTLKTEHVRAALKQWFEQGWATLEETIFQVTRLGRAHIKALAEQATAAIPA